MKRVLGLVASALLIGWVGAAAGTAFKPVEFDDPAQEQRYQALLYELRCTVCQNQSLAESNAGLAMDLRRQVYQMVSAGATESEVVDFMVSRYGDFVLYRPPLRPATFLLWGAPALLMGFGLVALYRSARNSGFSAEDEETFDRELAQRLLERGDEP